MAEKKRRKILKKLFSKYRLVILNEDTFEERFAIKLTRLNVFVIITLSAIILIVLTTLLIAFTSLREYIPGYSSTTLKKQALELSYKTDSLQRVLSMNEQYYASIRKVLTGDVAMVEFNKDSVLEAVRNEELIEQVLRSKEDSLLREKVSKEDKFNVFETEAIALNFVLFPPVNGTISADYSIEDKHFAVDISVPKDTPVKAVADGTVIFAEWTTDTGYVLILEHSQALISVYKHNQLLNKSQGDLVKAGEVIATAGSTGEYSTGTHLHFELWSKGYPVNPTNFIDFE